MTSAFSPSQVNQYLEYITLPKKYHPSANPPRDLELLTALHVHHLARIPFENLSLHYSASHTVSLDPQVIFDKTVGQARGRGGYCMENTILFNHVLRGLGFKVYHTGARIRPRVGGVPQGDYMGWVHSVNIVTLPDGIKYILDVAFGGDGPTTPLPILPGQVTDNIGTQQLRLMHEHLPEQTDTSPESQQPKFWVYQYRNGADKPWNAFYAFPELEFLPSDYEVMNFYTSTSPDSFQTTTVLVVKFLMRSGGTQNGVNRSAEGEDAVMEGEIYGKRMMVNGEIKENLGGKTQLVKTCTNEEERLDALREWFGIELTVEEQQGIRGRGSELK
ncbi:arylamine N-acetyltransferase 4 [Mycena sp. CBHHK59/15]|nr:arylamine N-acetyltransferase 4 [Mycena sp. CBHHK59/15]